MTFLGYRQMVDVADASWWLVIHQPNKQTTEANITCWGTTRWENECRRVDDRLLQMLHTTIFHPYHVCLV